MQVADSVLVNEAGTAPELLTRFSASDWASVSYEIKSEAEDSEEGSGDFDEASDIEEADPKRKCVTPTSVPCGTATRLL